MCRTCPQPALRAPLCHPAHTPAARTLINGSQSAALARSPHHMTAAKHIQTRISDVLLIHQAGLESLGFLPFNNPRIPLSGGHFNGVCCSVLGELGCYFHAILNDIRCFQTISDAFGTFRMFGTIPDDLGCFQMIWVIPDDLGDSG
eukprot:6307522-Pyramimonas_sp.AAC.1